MFSNKKSEVLDKAKALLPNEITINFYYIGTRKVPLITFYLFLNMGSYS